MSASHTKPAPLERQKLTVCHMARMDCAGAESLRWTEWILPWKSCPRVVSCLWNLLLSVPLLFPNYFLWKTVSYLWPFWCSLTMLWQKGRIWANLCSCSGNEDWTSCSEVCICALIALTMAVRRDVGLTFTRPHSQGIDLLYWAEEHLLSTLIRALSDA